MKSNTNNQSIIKRTTNTHKKKIRRPRSSIPLTVINMNDAAAFANHGIWIEYNRTLDWYSLVDDSKSFVLSSTNSGTHLPETVYIANITGADQPALAELLKYKLIYNEYMVREVNFLIKPIVNNGNYTAGTVYFKYVPVNDDDPTQAEMENQDPIVKIQGNQSRMIKVRLPYNGYPNPNYTNHWFFTQHLSSVALPNAIGKLAFETKVPMTAVSTTAATETQFPAFSISLRIRIVFRKPAILTTSTILQKLGVGH